MQRFLQPDAAPLLLLLGFFLITFLQSAVDKVVDRKGNLEFLSGHFKNSPLAGMVSPMLSTVTLVEFSSSLLCLIALGKIIISGDQSFTNPALSVVGVNLLMLLFGQRLAKDYAGASTLGIYMILVMAGFILLN